MDNQHHVKEMPKQETFTKVIVMPFHGQGHINQIFEFANHLAFKSNDTIHITIATTTSDTLKLNKISSNMDVFTIYDNSNDDLRLNFWSHMEKFESKAPLQLVNLLSTSPIRPSLLVYDAYLPWALNIAKQNGILSAAFFPHSCAYIASFYPIFVEEFKENVDHPLIVAANKLDGNSLPFSLVGPTQDELVHGLLTRLKSSDESSNGDKKLLHPLIKMVISFLTNLHQADWVLFNSFDRLDYVVCFLIFVAFSFLMAKGTNSIKSLS
ncbi:UDP glycosyltransferase 9-like isoform X2 [Amaranthus tricolor]|uniref:UDP glycosyltransferase 9-like isoform X2 n=1 Tax=Amaranthus tricolor TaxID=29722 RepID=UPI00258B6C57|nr:UDP glycosyltransferase 9-like isoform X2 [Amaranthus tricolor]